MLSIHNDNDCGGWNAYIEIFYNGSMSCKTKLWPSFKAGATLIRDKFDLGSCYGKDFDSNAKEIQFKVLFICLWTLFLDSFIKSVPKKPLHLREF